MKGLPLCVTALSYLWFCALRAIIEGRLCHGGGSYFLLLAQKKVTQEKDIPLTAPCVARHAGRLRHTIFRARMGTESRSPFVGNSHVSLREALLEQALTHTPGMAVLLGGAQGAPKVNNSGASKR